MRRMHGLDKLRDQGGMTWVEEDHHGWVGAPEAIVDALSTDGFEECKRATTTSRRDLRPAGGVWQGVNALTGSVASAIWVNHPAWSRSAWSRSIVFIAIDGEPFKGDASGLERNPYRDDGGES